MGESLPLTVVPRTFVTIPTNEIILKQEATIAEESMHQNDRRLGQMQAVVRLLEEVVLKQWTAVAEIIVEQNKRNRIMVPLVGELYMESTKKSGVSDR
jgi:hypothetical protein